MALPEEFTYVTVTGQVSDVPTGAARAAWFRCPFWLVGPTADKVVPPFTVNAVLDADGAFSVSLPATDDPAWQPTGGATFTYQVTITSDNKTLYGSLAVPYDTVGALDLADALNPEDSAAASGDSFLLAASRSAPGGVAALDVDGDVTDANGNKITGGGGGGGGPALANAVASGTSYSQAATAGVLATASRGDHSHGTPARAVKLVTGRRTSGDLTTTNDVTFTVVTDFSPAIAAVAGDLVEFTLTGLLDMGPAATEFFDLCTLVGGVATKYSSTGTGTAATEGDPAIYPLAGSRFASRSVSWCLAVAGGDLSGGNVTFGVAHLGGGAAKVLASATFPLRWTLKNYGQ